MRVRCSSCVFALLIAMVAASALADTCPYPSSAAIAYSGPDQYGHGTVTISYAFGAAPGAPAGGRVTFTAETPGGTHIESIDVGQQSGTWTFAYNVTCWPVNAYKFTASAGCGANSSSSTTVTPPDGTPTVMMSYSPDAAGHATWSIHYKFPNTDSPAQRNVTRIVHGPNWTSFDSLPNAEYEGDWVFEYDITCFKSFNYTFESTVSSCTGKTATQKQDVPVNSKPTVGLSLQGPDNTGKVVAIISYNFPNTDAAWQRSVTRAWYGPFGVSYNSVCNPIDQSGQCTFEYNVACWEEKAWRFDATATSCAGESDTKTDSVTPKADAEAMLDLARDASGSYTANVGWNFTQANGRYVRLEVLPTATEPGALIKELWPASDSGHDALALGTFNTERTIRATAVACGTKAKYTDAAVMPSCCPASGGASPYSGGPTSVGQPVRLFDGGVELTESDPLPYAIARSYSSTLQANGFFGVGWRSIFDAGIVKASSQWFDSVIVEMPDRTRATFRLQSGSWVQTWPKGSPAGTLTGSDAAGYRYRPGGGSIAYVFGTNRKLTGIDDLRAARQVMIAYDAAGSPSRVYDAGGSWSLTVTASSGHVTAIGVDGRPDIVWTYAYAGNLLQRVAMGSSAWRTYGYTGNRLTSVTDAIGHAIEEHAYDSVGRATSSLGSAGDITSIEYLADGARITRADGSQSTFAQQFGGGRDMTTSVTGGCASCGGGDTVYAYDARGRVTRAQDGRGFIAQYVYETAGVNLASLTRSLALAGCDPLTDAGHCRMTSTALASASLVPTTSTTTTSYTYGDPNWSERPTEERMESALVAGAQIVRHLAYDAVTGEVVEESVTGATGEDRHLETLTTRTALYDGVEGAAFNPGGSFDAAWLALPQPKGLRKNIDGPRSDVADTSLFVYYPFDASVPATWRGRLAAARDAAGHIVRYERYDVFGNAGVVIDADGVVTETTSDPLGRPLITTLRGVPGCNTSVDALCDRDLVTERTYAAVVGPLASEKRPNGGITAYEYDARGRIAAMTRQVSASESERVEYDYDAATGNRSAERFYGGAPGAWTLARAERNRYDAYGRLSAVEHSDGTRIVYAYDGANNLTGIQDENHASPNTMYSYDALHRVSAIGQLLGGAWIRTQYAYDVRGNLTSITDPNGNVTSYVYDDFGRMLRQTSPVTGVTTYRYDAAGNVVASTDANNAATTRIYDALNRVTSATSGGAGTETVSWTYDTRLRTMSDPTGSTAYDYDRRGLVVIERKIIEGNAFAMQYGYDADGNRSSITYPSGRKVTFGFDLTGRPVSAGAYVRSAAYLPFGPLTRLVFENGTTRTMQYDARYRPAENKLAGATTIADYMYAVDSLGNIRQIHDATDPSYDRDFGYDDLARLTTADSGSSLWGAGAYAYDPMGNTLSLSLGTERAATFAYSGTTSKLASVTENGSVRAVGYDPAGNELIGGEHYSPRNHLAGDSRVAYGYDGRGLRTIASQLVSIASVAITPAAAVGGTRFAATVTLTAPAGAGGLTVALVSDCTAATVPAVVTVADGQVSASFDVATAPVAGVTYATIRASADGLARSASLEIDPPVPAALTVTPPSVTAGANATATVVLNGAAPSGGAAVDLSSDNAAVSLPASVTVAASATSASFIVATSKTMSATTTATLRASIGTASASATLTIEPPPVVLAALSLSAASIVGGLGVTGTVALSNPAPAGGAAVALSSDDPSVAAVPLAVVVAEGSAAASFTIETNTILTQAVVAITASLSGVSQTVSLTVTPPPNLALLSLTVSPINVAGGSQATGTVTLTGPAPSGGADVILQSDDPLLVSVPSRITVRKNDTSASFTITTYATASVRTVRVSGSCGGLTQHDAVTVIPATAIQLTALAIAPTSVAGGAQAAGTVTINAPAPQGGIVVSLACKPKNVATVPSTVAVAEGSTSAIFTIATQTTKAPQHTATISATYAGVTRTADLTVTKTASAASVPVALSVTANVTATPPRRYTLYTPELNLMAETETTDAASPAIAYEYIWFAGQPVAQIETATNLVHFYFNDHLGTPILTTDAAGAVDWRVEREPYGRILKVRVGTTRHQPLAFPGQEDEGGARAYNVFRWYRPEWARYTQADPIALLGGVNLYAYALQNPIHVTDRQGLDTVGCDGYMWNLETRCELQCCAQHDKCYDSNHCSSGSWFFKSPKCGCDQTAACKKCNADVSFCVAKCNSTGDPGSSTGAMFYCPRQHRFIHIPGDFPDRPTAAKACEYDDSKECTIPLREPMPPQLFHWGPKYYSSSGV